MKFGVIIFFVGYVRESIWKVSLYVFVNCLSLWLVSNRVLYVKMYVWNMCFVIVFFDFIFRIENLFGCVYIFWILYVRVNIFF